VALAPLFFTADPAILTNLANPEIRFQ